MLTIVRRRKAGLCETGTGHALFAVLQVFVRGGTTPLVSKVPPPRSFGFPENTDVWRACDPARAQVGC